VNGNHGRYQVLHTINRVAQRGGEKLFEDLDR